MTLLIMTSLAPILIYVVIDVVGQLSETLMQVIPLMYMFIDII